MLFVVEEVDQLQEILLIELLTVCVDVTQQLDLVDRLIKVVLVVFNDLHAHHLFRMDVVALDGLGESSAAEILNDLIATGDNAVDNNWEVFGLFEASFLPIKNDTQIITVVNDTVKLGRIELIIRRHELDPPRQDRNFATIIIVKLFVFRLLFFEFRGLASSIVVLAFGNLARALLFLHLLEHES